MGAGPGEGARRGGCSQGPRTACPAPPAREVSCCNQSPVCVGLELELEPGPEQETGREGKKAVGWVFFSWRRPPCLLLATLTRLLFLLATPSVWVLSLSVPSGLRGSLSSCLGLGVSFSVYLK